MGPARTGATSAPVDYRPGGLTNLSGRGIFLTMQKTEQPRVGRGAKGAGQWTPKPVADDPDGGDLTLLEADGDPGHDGPAGGGAVFGWPEAGRKQECTSLWRVPVDTPDGGTSWPGRVVLSDGTMMDAKIDYRTRAGNPDGDYEWSVKWVTKDSLTSGFCQSFEEAWKAVCAAACEIHETTHRAGNVYI